MKREDFLGKPLPNHTKVNYDEVFAKLLLEEIFSEEFKNLKISDKPDLHDLDSGIGIEVTRSWNKKDVKNSAIYKCIRQEKDEKEKQPMIDKINTSYKRKSCSCKCCKRNLNNYNLCKDEHNKGSFFCKETYHACVCCHINENGCDYHKYRKCDRYGDGYLFGIPDNDNFERIIESFNDKIKKLNAGEYKKFDRNYLLIHSDILADQGMIKNAMKELNAFQSEYERKFHKVFVCVIGEIYVLHLDQNRGDILDIENKYHELSKKARDYVINIECNF